MAEEEFDTITPEIAADLAAAADSLLPIAHAQHELGTLPVTVAAWLSMIHHEMSLLGATLH